MYKHYAQPDRVSRALDVVCIGQLAGPLIFLLVLVLPVPQGLGPEGVKVAAALLWVVIWWGTGAVPIAMTSLLPLILFPLMSIDSLSTVAERYASPIIFLLIGGFILALALERAQLHRRLALIVLRKFTGSAASIIGGFMVATASMSMWISNTASTLIMLPIALSVVAEASSGSTERGARRFEVALLLGVAFSASVGGLGTLVGSPPNLLMAGYLQSEFGIEISFFGWLQFGLPIVVILLPVIWLSLTRLSFPIAERDLNIAAARSNIEDNYRGLGEMTPREKRVALVFGAVALCWITRPFLQGIPGLAQLSDTAIALIGAIVLFIVPCGQGGRLMDWATAEKLPWSVILLYGGGMALAGAMTSSGLTSWLVALVIESGSWQLFPLLLCVTAFTLILTELTNNSAALATLLPVLAAVTLSQGYPILTLIIPATLATSCAFMQPIATPPNAIVFATGKISIAQMASAGLLLNFLSVWIIGVLSFYLLS
tara:strand:+ start:1235 stop:2695 length:1461 start_codon:yes stop_codon:yes gene_type:complete